MGRGIIQGGMIEIVKRVGGRVTAPPPEKYYRFGTTETPTEPGPSDPTSTYPLSPTKGRPDPIGRGKKVSVNRVSPH